MTDTVCLGMGVAADTVCLGAGVGVASAMAAGVARKTTEVVCVGRVGALTMSIMTAVPNTPIATVDLVCIFIIFCAPFR